MNMKRLTSITAATILALTGAATAASAASGGGSGSDADSESWSITGRNITAKQKKATQKVVAEVANKNRYTKTQLKCLDKMFETSQSHYSPNFTLNYFPYDGSAVVVKHGLAGLSPAQYTKLTKSKTSWANNPKVQTQAAITYIKQNYKGNSCVALTKMKKTGKI